MKLSQLAQALGVELRPTGRPAGDDVEVQDVAAIHSATPASLVFAEDAQSFAAALASRAAAIIVSPKLTVSASDKSLLLAAQPKLAFARAARLLKPAVPASGLDPTAVIDPTTTLGEQVSVGPYAVIEANGLIGTGTRVGAGAVIGAGVKIGADCHIYPRVVIYSGTELGNHVVVHAGVVLGSDGFGYVRDAVTGLSLIHI